MNQSARTSILIIALAGVSALLYSSFVPLSEAYAIRQVQQGSLILPVEPIQQKQVTSCGEAAITMAYNYAYSEDPIQESDVITYATRMGYFTPDRLPFTSPMDMVKIAKNYTDEVSSGRVINQAQGLRLLIQKLQNNEPVIIDIRTRLDDPTAGAHFVVVTGIAIDPNDRNAILIYYNDPLTGRKESAGWAGEEGVWNAWRNNDDPGGSGWWMTIHVLS